MPTTPIPETDPTPVTSHRRDDDPPPDDPREERVITATQRAIVAELSLVGRKVDGCIGDVRILSGTVRALTDKVGEVGTAQKAAADREVDRDARLIREFGQRARQDSIHDDQLAQHGRRLTARQVIASGALMAIGAALPALQHALEALLKTIGH
jgi:hypothetical protein